MLDLIEHPAITETNPVVRPAGYSLAPRSTDLLDAMPLDDGPPPRPVYRSDASRWNDDMAAQVAGRGDHYGPAQQVLT